MENLLKASLPKSVNIETAREAFQKGTGKGIRIAIIDSGVETSHPGLAGLKLSDDVQIYTNGVRVCSGEGNGTDLFGHGTAVASVISKIAPEAEIGSFQVLDQNLGSRTVIIREGAREAIDRGYHILNCSFGCGVSDHVLQYKDWIDEAYLKGIHIVAACNNHDYLKPEWPGYFPTVVTVNMAKTDDDSRLFYKPGHLVEFAARGVNLQLPWNNEATKEVTGSSFAAPLVAGMLARLLSEIPDLTPLEAKSLLHRLAVPWSEDVAAQNVSYSTPN